MNCQTCNDSLLDLVEGQLPATEAERVSAHLKACPDCAERFSELSLTWGALDQLPKPSPDLARRFSVALEAYKRGQQENVRSESASGLGFFPRVLRNGYAFAASVALAFFAGALATRSLQDASATSDERLAAIEAELTDLKEFTALSLMTQNSAADRMHGAGLLATLRPDNQKSLEALYDKISRDPSTNVRYAALETLGAFANREDVRIKLIQFLENSDSPLIQAELIKQLVKHRERTAVPTLIRISQDGEQNETIRDLAIWAVAALEGEADETV